LHLVTNSTLGKEFEVQLGIYWFGFEGLKFKFKLKTFYLIRT
jgi:hypothetical protein